MSDKNNSRQLSSKAAQKILQLTFQHKASHVGGALSVIDILAVLYSDVLQFNNKDPKWADRDRLFYSKGHACTALYAVLCEVGFFSEDLLNSFTQDGSIFTSHVNHKVPGVELSTGSLGHALNVSCGVALALKYKAQPQKVYCILSDGELDEGSNWEALLFAPHHKLNNLTVIIDYNKIQSFGSVQEVLDLAPLADKFTSFGWHVIETDGHDHTGLLDSFKTATAKPKVIIAHTIKGKGVPFMENELAWHYKSPTKQDYEDAIKYFQTNEQ